MNFKTDGRKNSSKRLLKVFHCQAPSPAKEKQSEETSRVAYFKHLQIARFHEIFYPFVESVAPAHLLRRGIKLENRCDKFNFS